MAHITADRIKEASGTSGTGAFVLDGAVLGAKTFSSEMADTDTCYYTVDDSLGNWEVGVGTYASGTNTLARTVVLESSNAGSLVDFSSDPKVVFITNPATNTPKITTGTFTPTITGSTIVGSLTYSRQTGMYMRIGNLVYVIIDVVWTAGGVTPTGNMHLSNLPFASLSESMLGIGLNQITFSATIPCLRVESGVSHAAFHYFASGGTLTPIPVDTAGSVVASGAYFTGDIQIP